MSKFINFSKVLKHVETGEGCTVHLPGFCSKRIHSYRFNTETEIVEILCKECGKAYPVLKLDGDNWTDVHKENEYHFMSEKSGYDAVCMACKGALRQPAGISQAKKPAKRPTESYTVFLTPENKKYLQLYKIIFEEEITDVVNRMIDELRIKKPIKLISE